MADNDSHYGRGGVSLASKKTRDLYLYWGISAEAAEAWAGTIADHDALKQAVLEILNPARGDASWLHTAEFDKLRAIVHKREQKTQ